MARRVRGTAGELLAARIREQAARVLDLEAAVRADEADSVHQLRVAARRLRSALRSYRDLLDGDRGATVQRLREVGAALGGARDGEVLAERLLAQARELPADGGRDAVLADLTRWSARQSVDSRPQVLAELGGERWRDLTRELAELAEDPGLSKRARQPAGPEATRVLRREWRRTAARVEAALAAGPDGATEGALHEARKAAKRARYAGEAVGEPAAGFTARMKTLQDLLGRHQDAAVAARAVRTLSDGGFGYGALYGLQLGEMHLVREQLPEVWREAGHRPPKLR
ncbi:CHAD domain-containing protein [Kitasatospora sp. NPDC048365]|uniref:CHAD domain-containing protein n=1 Tax=Kitasatospora sp. NPDC048365 TaxID=3364050 RepID=UPI0037108A00